MRNPQERVVPPSSPTSQLPACLPLLASGGTGLPAGEEAGIGNKGSPISPAAPRLTFLAEFERGRGPGSPTGDIKSLITPLTNKAEVSRVMYSLRACSALQGLCLVRGDAEGLKA